MPNLYNNFILPNSNNFSLTKDSIPWFLLSSAIKFKKILFVCKNEKELNFLEVSLKKLSSKIKVLTFPEWNCPLFTTISPSENNKSSRINAIMNLLNSQSDTQIILTTFKSLLIKTLPKSELISKQLNLKKSEKNFSIEKLSNFLSENGYKRTDTVRQKSDYSIRGGIIDFFCATERKPVRLDFFSSYIESIKYFDPLSQLSNQSLNQIKITPASEFFFNNKNVQIFRTRFREENIKDKSYAYESISNKQEFPGYENFLPFMYEKLESFLNYTNNLNIVMRVDYQNEIDGIHQSLINTLKGTDFDSNNFKSIVLDKDELKKHISDKKVILISNLVNHNFKKITRSLPKINLLNNDKSINNFELFLKDKLKDHRILITSKNEFSKSRIKKTLNGKDIKFSDNLVDCKDKNIPILNLNLSSGFITENNNNSNLLVISDEDLFGKKKFQSTKKRVNAENYISEINTLKNGDFIVHSEHGIGKFLGLKNIPLYQVIHECIEVEYFGSDKLFIPVENLDLISRYGAKDSLVSLDKLGAQNWQLRKASIKDKIKFIALDLIKIAADRELKKGIVISADQEKYGNFASSFEFAETSDQINAIIDVESDLLSGKPMDRLICGDVGFGKTEVAMRASFIVANSGYQVAIICPTTLLVNQHFNTFSKRFKSTDLKISKISRFESTIEKKKIKNELLDNKIKIIIGTHALLNDDIEFENLGLVVIDEEQSFGVEQKEKLKKMKSNVHVLTLSATPIPRTLQFAILGIRDLSLITTPPINRTAIKTFTSLYDKKTIKNAIEHEINRNGQIFYVSPKIKDLNNIYKNLKSLLPHLRYEIVHGGLNGEKLKNVYRLFQLKEVDVLISTSIIESGIDISNANTIIIEKPNYFGLSQLYQIRGRVGRSDVQAYAYLILPQNTNITENAKKRLETLNNLDTLGAGFTLASQDMDIRGTGNILGSEQSGHIKEVGIELYQKLIKDAIYELKNKKNQDDDWSPQINLGFPVFIPKEFIPEINIRLNIYRRISNSNTVEDLKIILFELEDRFGKVPKELLNLAKIIEIKNLCKKANIKKIDLGNKGFIIKFKNDKFKSFDKIIGIVKKNPEILKLKTDYRLIYMKKWEDSEKAIKDIIYFLKLIS